MNQLTNVPVGIDLGSWTSKVAVAKRGGVEVITNEANFRETPVVVGYGPAERHIGQAGNIKMKSNFRDTVTFPTRFVGLGSEYPFLRAEKRFCPGKCINKDDKIAFEVKYQGQQETLYPQQVLAAYINKLKHILAVNKFENKSGVVAVPTYFTQHERKAVFEAARIAEFNIIRLINESTAIALDYGMFRKKDLDAKTPRNVLLVDFGHSKLSISACSFLDSEMTVLEQEHCRHLGCRDIDYNLYEFYKGIFEKSSGGLDLSENRKSTLKLMENIEKQRKVLSGNQQHDMNLQFLMEDEDLHYTMKREEFQRLAEPIFAQVADALKKVKASLEKKGIKLHSIELVGGGTRIPAFVQMIKGVFGMDPSRTLNSSESVARGCALMAAIKSPLFRVPDYILNERVYYGVKFFWNFVEGNNFLGLDSSLYPEKQAKFIYDVGAKVPSSKTIKFTRKEAMQVLIEYEPVVNGFKKHIGYFVTKPQNPKEETFGVTFKIKFTEDGLVTFEECALNEEWFEQTKIPKKKKEEKKDDKKEAEMKDEKKEGGQPEKMEEEEFEIKKTKKDRFTQIKYDSNTFDPFSSKELENFFTLESTMANQDRIIIETYERKNELQSMAYTWRQKLSGNYGQFARPEQVQPIIAFLQEQSDWLYGDGTDASRGVYNDRITAVKNKINPIQKRYEHMEMTVHELKKLEDALKSNMDLLNSLDKKHEHITPEERQEGFSQIDRIKAWVLNADQKQKNKPKFEDPVISLQQVKDQIKEINQKVKKIMGKPAPAPPKEEKKEEMKDEKKEGGEKGEKMDEETPAAAEKDKMEVE